MYAHVQVCMKKILNITGTRTFDVNKVFFSLKEFQSTGVTAVNGFWLGSKLWMLTYQTLMMRQLRKVDLYVCPLSLVIHLKDLLLFRRVGKCFAPYFYLFHTWIYLLFFLEGRKTWESSRALFLTSPDGDFLQTQT